MIDKKSYIIGHTAGQKKSTGTVVIESGITCADDGDGNITITVEEDSDDG